MAGSAQLLRQKMEEDRPLLFAGVYDALSARIAQDAGFDGLWVSGYGVAASMLGLPDIGYITLSEMANTLRHICNAVDIPVVCDGEVGYGNAINVMRTVEEFISAGAVGMQMGDAEYENCPYLGLPTKPLDEETAMGKIRAVQSTRGDNDFMLFASQVHALERSEKYAAAGAEGLLFPWEPVISGENPEWNEALKKVIDHGTAPVAVLAPFLQPAHKDELYEHGYKIIVMAAENLYASAHVQKDLWAHYMKEGSIAGFENRMYTHQEDFLPLVREAEVHAAAQKFLSPDYQPNVRKKFAKV